MRERHTHTHTLSRASSWSHTHTDRRTDRQTGAVPTQLQQGAHNLGLDMGQLAVEAALSRCQLMEASDEAHNICVRQCHTLATARKHTADVAELQGKE